MTTSPGWDFSEGQEIVPERYALRLLGGGHKYEAWLAFDEVLHCIVVAKLLRPHLVNDASSLRMLHAEAAALGRLAHPVLHRCFGVVTDQPRPHLVLEHLEGPRLSTLLRRQKRLALEQAIPLGVQLSSALHYMHRQGYVHLDVKPKNVIMGAVPRLIDLSVARPTTVAEAARDAVGTDAYMAPEQCEPRLLGGMGPAADAWGWGVTMYEAVTGMLPFPRASDDEAVRWPQLHLDPAPMTSEVPPRLAELVMSCLERRPEDRPAQSAIADSLEPLVAALPHRRILSRLRPGLR